MKFSKPFFVRLFLFAIGGGLSIGINTSCFWLFYTALGWNRFLSYALSLAIINVLLFLWNYFVGFRGSRSMGDSAWRQGVCLAGMNVLNYVLVTTFHGVFPDSKKLVIAVVQVFVAFLKFGAYHYWVFPHRDQGTPAQEASRTL